MWIYVISLYTALPKRNGLLVRNGCVVVAFFISRVGVLWSRWWISTRWNVSEIPHWFCSSVRLRAVSRTCLQDSEGASDPRVARAALSLPDVKFDRHYPYNVRGVAVLSAGGLHLLESFFSSGTLERKTHTVRCGQHLEVTFAGYAARAFWLAEALRVLSKCPSCLPIRYFFLLLCVTQNFELLFFFSFSPMLADLCSCEHSHVYVCFSLSIYLCSDGREACLLF